MSSSSYFDARKRNYGAHYDEDESIIKDIEDIRNDPKMKDASSLGYRPLTQYINQKRIERNEPIVNHKRVLRIMKQNELLSGAYSRKTNKYNSFAGEGHKRHKNHIRQRFITDRPYQKLGTDVTEVRWGKQTTDERLFISLFCDFYSGEIVSYSISLHPTTEFVLKSLYPVMELAKGVPYLTTIHSDQGIQYQSNKYQMILRRSNIRQSMSRKGTPYDNSPTESLIHKMKIGTVLNHNYATQAELVVAIKEWIHYYNHERIRQSNNWETPIGFRESYASKNA